MKTGNANKKNAVCRNAIFTLLDMVKRLPLISVLILAGICTICVNPLTSHAAGTDNTGPQKLKVLVRPYLSFAPFYIARDEGFFAEQNLEVEFVKLRRAESIVALAQGEIDTAADFMSPAILNAIFRGAQIRAVADKYHFKASGCTSTAILASRKLVEAGKLETAEDIKGLRISTKPMTGEAYYVDLLMKEAGLSLVDLSIVKIPTAAAELTALNQGAVELAAVSEPWTTRVLQGGKTVVWKSVNEELPGMQFAVLFFGPNLLEKRPEVGKRFMVAYVKALREYNRGKTARNIEIIAGYTKLAADLLKSICWPTFRSDGRVDVATLLDYQTWAVEKGYLKATLTAEQIWDPRFTDAANTILGDTQD